MHQLYRESLQVETDIDRFFSRYLGEPVMQKLEEPLVQFSTWPELARQALRALAILYAEVMPEADHVIRADVGRRGHAPDDVPGEFLMYFGFQTGQRAHYTCVAHARTADAVNFIVYVGGWSSPQRRNELIGAEDAARVLEGRVLSSADDVMRFADKAARVLQAQRELLIRDKQVATSGFCPSFCQQNWGQVRRRPEQDCSNAVWEYWKDRRRKLSPEQAQRELNLMRENNWYRRGRAVAYVRDHVPVEQAYALALSEHA